MTSSRFKVPTGNDTARGFPVSGGKCLKCLREFWQGGPSGVTLLRGSDRYPGHCDTCAQWMRKHPGVDPRGVKGNQAERIPAERAEDDPSWRDAAGMPCHEAPPELFDPEDDPEDLPPLEPAEFDQMRRDLWQQRREVAAVFCEPCPVRAQCRAAAEAHGYEGMWGATFFTRRRWHDLINGVDGPTINAPARARREAEEAQDAQVPA